MSREVDFAAKPIDPDFMNKPDEYPETGTHFDHKVFADGVERLGANGNPYPTKLGIHGLHVAVDFDGCVADGVCMDVCPGDVFEWLLAPGKKGTGDGKIIEKGREEGDKEQSDNSDLSPAADCS